MKKKEIRKRVELAVLRWLDDGGNVDQLVDSIEVIVSEEIKNE